jgi:hypothetical protein
MISCPVCGTPPFTATTVSRDVRSCGCARLTHIHVEDEAFECFLFHSSPVAGGNRIGVGLETSASGDSDFRVSGKWTDHEMRSPRRRGDREPFLDRVMRLALLSAVLES